MKSLLMVIVLMPAMLLAEDLPEGDSVDIAFLSWDDDQKKLVEDRISAGQCKTLTSTTKEISGWYVAKGKVTCEEPIVVIESAHLILMDGCTLTVQNGIRVPEKTSFTVYGQAGGTGVLNASCGKKAFGRPAIGCGNPSVSGPKPDANSGTVTINGGWVTATGDKYAAGIGSSACGKYGPVTINGGRVTATGGMMGAGIGNGRDGRSGAVVINGGIVTATGQGGAAGIGCGRNGEGGMGTRVEINGGTVTAKGGKGGGIVGADIGYLPQGREFKLGAFVKVTGGCIMADSISCRPVSENPSGPNLYKVTVILPWKADPLKPIQLNGLTGYGTNDIYPLGNRLYLYLPNGKHYLSVLDSSGKAWEASFAVCGDAAVVSLGKMEEFYINGELFYGDGGTGWTAKNDRLVLDGSVPYVLSGDLRRAGIDVPQGATVTLSNTTIHPLGVPVSVSGGKTLNLQMSGFTSYLFATNNAPAIALGEKAQLTVGAVPGAERLAEIIAVNVGNTPAISGEKGSTTVESGSFLVKSDVKAAAGSFGISEPPACPLLMKTGSTPDEVRFANAYNGEAFVGVVPSFTITVPPFEGIESVVVSNDIEELKGENGVYRAMLTEEILIRFVAKEGYVIVSGERLYIPSLTNDVTVGSEEYLGPETIEAWSLGEGVWGHMGEGGVLLIQGSGAMDDFAAATDVPWDPAEVAAVEIGREVTTVGKNAFVTLPDETPINGRPLPFWESVVAASSPEPDILEGKVAADVESLEISGGIAHLGISVKTNGNVAAEKETWGKFDVKEEDVSVTGGSVIIAVPANAEKGFMTLESGAVK